MKTAHFFRDREQLYCERRHALLNFVGGPQH